jgi:hypothetical protein
MFSTTCNLDLVRQLKDEFYAEYQQTVSAFQKSDRYDMYLQAKADTLATIVDKLTDFITQHNLQQLTNKLFTF